MSSPPLILGIETSCDETAAAVVRGREVLGHIVASQHDLHEEYAGVVPEIASRAHLERITPVVDRAINEAGIALSDVNAVAVGHRPGLIGSLLVGLSAAKALAWALDKSFIGVDHILAHLIAPALDTEPIVYPALGLVVSGGHTSLFHLDSAIDARMLGSTIDDAVGEAYDKAATILHAGYPGGPNLDRLAQHGDDRAHDFPIASLGRDRLDFSFSGLKTSLLYAVCGQPQNTNGKTQFERDGSILADQQRRDFAASFQRAAITALMRKLRRATKTQREIRTIIVGGGVSANSRFRRELRELEQDIGIPVRMPQPEYCIDNAAMIAALAAERYERGEGDDLGLAPATSTAIHR